MVSLSVDLPLCHDREPCKNGSTNWDAIWDVDLCKSKEACIRWESRSPWLKGERGKNLRAKSSRPVTCLDMSGGQYTESDSAGGRTSMVQIPVGVLDGGAHWHNLANTAEPSVRQQCIPLSNYCDHLFHSFSASLYFMSLQQLTSITCDLSNCSVVDSTVLVWCFQYMVRRLHIGVAACVQGWASAACRKMTRLTLSCSDWTTCW